MNDKWEINFLSYDKKARHPPNPKYPDGIDIDTGERPACKVDLPYPAECCGVWLVRCNECKKVAAITAAGRPDDPRSAMLPCKVTVQ